MDETLAPKSIPKIFFFNAICVKRISSIPTVLFNNIFLSKGNSLAFKDETHADLTCASDQ